ncbi:MAG TPA: amidohydrolase family protein [Acidimicrobiia bacterium]|nr:amidohydrolase family protein [Acidimicrobiia bacterium]
MSLRVVLKTPDGDTVLRDVVDGIWVSPTGDGESTIGEGLWALPGLTDAHAHLAAAQLDFAPGDFSGAVQRARDSLEAGVTLILDKGWSDDTTVRLIEEIPAEERPDIEAAEQVIAGVDGYVAGFGYEVGEADFEEAVRNQARAGAGWVKLIGDWPRRGVGPVSPFDAAQLRAAVEIAEDEGSRVAIHTMAREVPSAAVAAGVHSIEHGLFLEEDDLDLLGSRAGMWVPTLLRCEATIHQLGESSTGGRLLTEGLERMRRLLPLAVEAGVLVLPGTDLIGSPADVAAEAMKLSEYGLSNQQVVDAVSKSGFVGTGRSADFAVGSPANAVFFDDNPMESLAVLDHPRHVLRMGRVI